jgi:hypothetical protein
MIVLVLLTLVGFFLIKSFFFALVWLYICDHYLDPDREPLDPPTRFPQERRWPKTLDPRWWASIFKKIGSWIYWEVIKDPRKRAQ